MIFMSFMVKLRLRRWGKGKTKITQIREKKIVPTVCRAASSVRLKPSKILLCPLVPLVANPLPFMSFMVKLRLRRWGKGKTKITQIREESTDLPAGRQVSQIRGLKFHRLGNGYGFCLAPFMTFMSFMVELRLRRLGKRKLFPLSAGRHLQEILSKVVDEGSLSASFRSFFKQPEPLFRRRTSPPA